MVEIEITGYIPGSLGRIIELHGQYYAKYWDLGLYFEAKVATELSEFLSRFDLQVDGAWFAQVKGQIVGGIFIDGSKADGIGARIRWFILDEDYQGLGIGKLLMQKAMTFCAEKQFRRVYLTTFSGLNTACHLYEKNGFRLCGEEDGADLTGKSSLIEQVFEYIPAEYRL